MKTEPNSTVPPQFARDHLKRDPALRQQAVAAGIEAIQRGETGLGLKLLRRAWEADQDAALKLPRFEDADFRAFSQAAGARGETFKEFLRTACVGRVAATVADMPHACAPELAAWLRGEIQRIKKP